MRLCQFISCFISIIFFCEIAFSDVHVRGYYRKNGTYVAPHYRSSPNQTKSDNWSTKGNINPYTGKPGTKPIIFSQDPFTINTAPINKYPYENTDSTGFIIYKWIDKNNVTHYSDKPPP